MGESEVPSKHICSILAFLSLLLAVYTVATTYVPYLSSSEWGLVFKLPVSFWTGLGFLFLLIYFGKESNKYMAVAFVLTLLYLYGIPTLIEQYASQPSSYYPTKEAAIISSKGQFVQNKKDVLISYHNWPFYLYLTALIQTITKMPLDDTIKYFPLFIISFYGILVYLILKIKLSTSKAFLGTILFLGSLWQHQHYLGGQGISFIYFLLIFLVTSWSFFEKKKQKRLLLSLVFFLFVSSIFTHPLTPWVTLAGMMAIYVIYRAKTEIHTRASTYGICVLMCLTLFAYLSFEATPFFDYALHRTFAEISDVGVFIHKQLYGVQLKGSVQQSLTNLCRLSITSINMIVLFITGLFFVFRRKTLKQEVYWVALASAFALVSVISPYGTEMLYRISMFMMVPIAYLQVKIFGLHRRFHVFYIILIAILLLHIPAHYGSETHNIVTNMDLSGSAFYARYANQTPEFLLKAPSVKLMWYQNPNLTRTRFVLTVFTNPTLLENATLLNETIQKSEYIVLSESGSSYLVYYFGVDALQDFDFDKNHNRVYDSSYYNIYEKPRQ